MSTDSTLKWIVRQISHKQETIAEDFSCHTFSSDLSNFHLYLLLPSFQCVDSRIF